MGSRPGGHPIETAIGLVAVAALILANGAFVAQEFALVAVEREQVERLAREGDRRGRHAAWALRRLSFNLSGAQLGITATSLVLGFVTESTVAEVLAPVMEPLPEAARGGVAVVVALAVVTVLQMVVGELVPKNLAVARPLAVALVVAAPGRAYATVFGPLIRFLNGAADRTVRWFGIEPQEELNAVRSLDELELLIRSSGQEGTLDATAASLLTRTIRFRDKTAADVLVPRTALVTVPATATVADLSRAAIDSGHSRLVVVGEGLDDVVGVAHAQDVLSVPPGARPSTPVTAVSGQAYVVPEGRSLESLLTDLREQGGHLAVVVDEYGGTAGIVTLEDLLEEIVGEIEDEHDPAGPEPRTTELPEGTWVLEGSLHLDEVADVSGLALPEGEYETLAGFVLDRLGHLPVVGERVLHLGWTLEVLEMDRRRIAAVRTVAPPPASAEGPA